MKLEIDLETEDNIRLFMELFDKYLATPIEHDEDVKKDFHAAAIKVSSSMAAKLQIDDVFNKLNSEVVA